MLSSWRVTVDVFDFTSGIENVETPLSAEGKNTVSSSIIVSDNKEETVLKEGVVGEISGMVVGTIDCDVAAHQEECPLPGTIPSEQAGEKKVSEDESDRVVKGSTYTISKKSSSLSSQSSSEEHLDRQCDEDLTKQLSEKGSAECSKKSSEDLNEESKKDDTKTSVSSPSSKSGMNDSNSSKKSSDKTGESKALKTKSDDTLSSLSDRHDLASKSSSSSTSSCETSESSSVHKLDDKAAETKSLIIEDLDEPEVKKEKTCGKTETSLLSSIFRKKDKTSKVPDKKSKSKNRDLVKQSQDEDIKGSSEVIVKSLKEDASDHESGEEKLKKDLAEKEKRTSALTDETEKEVSVASRSSVGKKSSSSGSTSNSSSISDLKDESIQDDGVECVPFFYYVTPKQFRDKKQAGTSDMEKCAREELKRHRERVASKESAAIDLRAKEIEEQRKAGFFSLPRMVDSKEAYAAEEAKEIKERSHFSLPRFMSPRSIKEGAGKEEGKASGLSRLKNFLLRRGREDSLATDDESSISEVSAKKAVGPQQEAGGGSGPKKRPLFQLKRLHRDDGVTSSESDLNDVSKSAVPDETKSKSSSLTRPRTLWFGRKESVVKESPPVAEDSPVAVMVTKPSNEPIAEGSELKQKKQRINFTLKGLTGSKESKSVSKEDDAPIVTKQVQVSTEATKFKENDVVLHRSPSYDLAIYQHEYGESPKKSVFESGSDKIKRLFKNQSVTLRNPFSRSADGKDKRKSFPVTGRDDEGPYPLGGAECSSAPDISDRHPSISTFIDDTPITGSPPPVVSAPAAPSSSFHALSTNNSKNDATKSPPPPATAAVKEMPVKCEENLPVNLDEPPHYPPPDIPVEEIDSSSSSNDSCSEEEECDKGNDEPEGRSDWTASLEQTLRSSIERKLITFSLPPNSSRSGAAAVATTADDVRPMERAIETRQQAPDYLGSMVRCLYLSKCFIANSEW